MENKLTTEEIAKVFAMYWGQDIVCRPEYEEHSGSPIHNALSLFVLGMFKIENHILLLYTLPDIADEHAIEAAELINDKKYPEAESFKVVKEGEKISVYSSEVRHSDMPSFGFRYETKLYADGYAVKMGTSRPTYQMPYEAYQYLIQKGYAVPLFFGVNHWANGKTAIELGIAIKR